MIVTTYCTAQSLILQLISSDELLVLLWVSVIEVTVGAGGGPINYSELQMKCSMLYIINCRLSHDGECTM